MTNASLADLAGLAVELRQVTQRVNRLERRFRDARPRLRTPLHVRIVEIARKRRVIEMKQIVHALDAEGALSQYDDPYHTASMAVLRAAKRGILHRVARGIYAISDPDLQQ